jgi:hypothetical protein
LYLAFIPGSTPLPSLMADRITNMPLKNYKFRSHFSLDLRTCYVTTEIALRLFLNHNELLADTLICTFLYIPLKPKQCTLGTVHFVKGVRK